jgi:hypothetical protein
MTAAIWSGKLLAIPNRQPTCRDGIEDSPLLNRLRRANPEQRKLLFSLSMSVLTRIPGAAGILIFLPLLRFGLGTDDYASLLTAMALGVAASFLSGGFNYVGRRMIGEAYTENNHQGEADAFSSLIISNCVAFGFTLIINGGYCWLFQTNLIFFIVASLSALVPIMGQFDDVRAAYNELYVSAILMFGIQSLAYVVGIAIPMFRQSMLLGILVIVGPYLLASLTSFALLVRNRPYLVTGHPIATWLIIRRGTLLAIADGLMLATLSLSVVFLQTTASTTTAAWYGTLVRLFQTFLVPVILLLFPISSYVRLVWNRKTAAQQQAFTKITLLIGISYGAIVSITLLLVSWFYIEWLLKLPAPVGLLHLSPIFLLFAAIIAYKSYSQIAYLVLETTHLSSWTTIGMSGGVVLGAIASLVVDPMSAIGVYALTAGLATITILIWNAMRFIRVTGRATVTA